MTDLNLDTAGRFRLIRSCGHVKKQDDRYPHYRAFCARHARRGDGGRDDADRNYEVADV